MNLFDRPHIAVPKEPLRTTRRGARLTVKQPIALFNHSSKLFCQRQDLGCKTPLRPLR